MVPRPYFVVQGVVLAGWGLLGVEGGWIAVAEWQVAAHCLVGECYDAKGMSAPVGAGRSDEFHRRSPSGHGQGCHRVRHRLKTRVKADWSVRGGLTHENNSRMGHQGMRLPQSTISRRRPLRSSTKIFPPLATASCRYFCMPIPFRITSVMVVLRFLASSRITSTSSGERLTLSFTTGLAIRHPYNRKLDEINTKGRNRARYGTVRLCQAVLTCHRGKARANGRAVKLIDDAAWNQQRERAILAAFQTGHPVFADSDGVLRYVDGDCEPVADDVGSSKTDPATVKRPWWRRVWMGGGL